MVQVRPFLIIACLSALLTPYAGSAFAQPIPGSADIDQIKPAQRNRLAPKVEDSPNYIPSPLTPDTPPPPQAKDIMALLKEIHVEGVTVFSPAEVEAIYKPYLGKEVPLDTVWKVAAALTAKYRDAGYFLSRAYIPAQEVDNGVFLIKVVEGYIGKVDVGGPASDNPIITKALDRIMALKPVNVRMLERELLLLNDLPGLTFQSTLAPLEDDDEASVLMVLKTDDLPATAVASIDNAGSRYLGPYQMSASWEFSALELQHTAITAMTSLFGKELYALSLLHKIMVSSDTSIDLDASRSNATPGYTLKPQEIRSRSTQAGIGVSHKFIRQRDMNLSAGVSLDMRNSDSDILGFVLSRDRTRVMNIDVNYDLADPWHGYNYFVVNMRRGIDGFGSSDAGDLDISRTGAKPDFFKTQVSYTRLQGIGTHWSGMLSLAGQKSSGSLYSSEEFGYGGTVFGRAYDNSEISGDDGVAASVELRYQGVPNWNNITFNPYAFYDVGKVWNNNIGQPDAISGSSAGIGLYFQYNSALSGNLYAAQPLTKPVDTPLNGGNGHNPRYMVQVSYKF